MATAAVTVVKSLGSRCGCIDTLNTSSNIVTVLLLCFLDVPDSYLLGFPDKLSASDVNVYSFFIDFIVLPTQKR